MPNRAVPDHERACACARAGLTGLAAFFSSFFWSCGAGPGYVDAVYGPYSIRAGSQHCRRKLGSPQLYPDRLSCTRIASAVPGSIIALIAPPPTPRLSLWRRLCSLPLSLCLSALCLSASFTSSPVSALCLVLSRSVSLCLSVSARGPLSSSLSLCASPSLSSMLFPRCPHPPSSSSVQLPCPDCSAGGDGRA